MHWHNGAGDNRAVNNKTMRIMNSLLKSKMRVKKPWEIYSKKYYMSHVRQEVEASMLIIDVTKKIRDIFENESPEIQEEIRQLSEAQKGDAKKRKKSCKASEEPTDLESDDDGGEDETVETDPLVRRR